MIEFATGDLGENAEDTFAEATSERVVAFYPGHVPDGGQAQKHMGEDRVIDWAISGSPYRAWTGMSTVTCFG